MKTTLIIDDTVMAELEREASRQGRTISEMIEAALRGTSEAGVVFRGFFPCSA